MMARDSADGTFVIDVPDPGPLGSGDALSLATIEQLDGSCATLTRRSTGGFLQLADGRVFGPSAKPGEHIFQEAPGPFAADAYDRRTSAEKRLPLHRGSRLLLSVRVNSHPAGGDFVGVWRVGKKWLIRSFTQREDRSFAKLRPVLSSRLPVRSITYFSSPDTPSGRLEMVQEQRDGRARSLAFHWSHGLAFKQR